MSELLSIFNSYYSELSKCELDAIKIGDQVTRNTSDFCDIYKELTFIYIRYTGTNKYYKDIETISDPSEPDKIIKLISDLRSKLSLNISALYSDLLKKSKGTIKSYLKYNSICSSNLVSKIKNPVTSLHPTESNFFTSLVEFCEFIHYARELTTLKIFEEADLDFFIAVCIYSGFKIRKKKLSTEKTLDVLCTIFKKYSRDIEVPDSGFNLNGNLVYRLFSSCNSISLVFLKQVKDMILDVYIEYIKDFDKFLNEFNQKVADKKITNEDSQTFIKNLNVSHNLFIFTNFSHWKTCSIPLLNLINQTYLSYQQANQYFHSLSQ